MELHIISGNDIEKYRELLLPYINSFVTLLKGRYDFEDIFNLIKEERWTLWVVEKDLEIEAIIVTQIVKYPKIREFQIILCDGKDYKNWYYLINKMEDYAKLAGCDKMVALGRVGWEKIMQGYKKSYICIERDL